MEERAQHALLAPTSPWVGATLAHPVLLKPIKTQQQAPYALLAPLALGMANNRLQALAVPMLRTARLTSQAFMRELPLLAMFPSSNKTWKRTAVGLPKCLAPT